jgi:hypothetical protein
MPYICDEAKNCKSTPILCKRIISHSDYYPTIYCSVIGEVITDKEIPQTDTPDIPVMIIVTDLIE